MNSIESGVETSNATLNVFVESTRSLDVLAVVRQALAKTGYAELMDVTVYGTVDQVVLLGNVGSFFLKQLAQEVTKGLPQIGLVLNRIEVA